MSFLSPTASEKFKSKPASPSPKPKPVVEYNPDDLSTQIALVKLCMTLYGYTEKADRIQAFLKRKGKKRLIELDLTEYTELAQKMRAAWVEESKNGLRPVVDF